MVIFAIADEDIIENITVYLFQICTSGSGGDVYFNDKRRTLHARLCTNINHKSKTEPLAT